MLLGDMANSATDSGVQIKYIQTASPTANLQPTVSDSQNNLLAPQDQLKEEITVTPTIIVTPTPAVPIQYDFFNVRVFGVIIGLVFLWIYVRGLRKKKD